MLDKSAILTLIGVGIIEMATGIINDWGSVNVYYLTYIHYRQPSFKIDHTTSSTFAIIVLLPTITAVALTNKVNSIFGYKRVINICGIMYFVSGLIAYLFFNVYTMLIFCLLIPVLGFSLAIVPIFHCLYSHFLESKNKVTAFAVISFGVGAILWNQFCTLYINPHNQQQSVVDQSGVPMFFSEQIANRVPVATHIIIIGGGFLFMIGSFMISEKTNGSELARLRNEQNQQSFAGEAPCSNKQTIKNQKQPLQEQKMEKQEQIDKAGSENIQEDVDLQIQKEQERKQHLQDIKSPTFIILILIALFGSVYHVYIQINMKIIYGELIKDDHFVSNGMTAVIAAGLIGAAIWGFCGDHFGAIKVVVLYCFVDFIIKFYSCFANNKPTFMVAMALLGFTDKAILTLFGPSLIQAFGLHRASKLLTYKFMTLIGSIMIASLLKIVFSMIPSNVFLFMLLIFSVINIIIGVRLWKIRHPSS